MVVVVGSVGEIDIGVVRFDGSVSLARGGDGVWNFERLCRSEEGVVVVVVAWGGASGGGGLVRVVELVGWGGWVGGSFGSFEAGGLVSVRDALGGSGGGWGWGG